jgi:integrase
MGQIAGSESGYGLVHADLRRRRVPIVRPVDDPVIKGIPANGLPHLPPVRGPLNVFTHRVIDFLSYIAGRGIRQSGELGRLPWSYPHILRLFTKAATDAEIAHVSPHVMRHTHRAWLDAVGTPIAVQQKLMRHASITTTMDHYGDVVTDEMARASGKVAGLALNGTGSGTGPVSSH